VRRCLAGTVDWKQFLALAQRHRVIPHAYTVLNDVASDLVPPAAMEHLRDHYRANAQRNLQMAQELASIGRALNDAAIPAMCLKGLATAIQVYGGVHGRQFRDLDILVPEEHIVHASVVLNNLGYHERTVPIASLGTTQLKHLMRLNKELKFVKRGEPPFLVELHWSLTEHDSVFSIKPGQLWSAGENFRLGRARFHTLPQAENNVFLAWHGSMHRWKRLSWLFDWYRTLESTPDLNWRSVSDLASQFGARRYLELGVRVLERLEFSIPGQGSREVFGRRTSRRAERTANLALQAMLADEGEHIEDTLNSLCWLYRMSTTWRPVVDTILRAFAPHVEDLTCGSRWAYAHRWWRMLCLSRNVVAARMSRKTI